MPTNKLNPSLPKLQPEPSPSNPMLTATIQSAFLSLISNLLAQTIKCLRDDKPITLSPLTVFHFVFFSFISTPPNYIWQESLEAWFPSHPPPSPPLKEKSDPAVPPQTPPLSKTNLLKKFLTDQIISGPLNNLVFLAYMKFITNLTASSPPSSNTEIIQSVIADFPGLWVASLKLWPAVALISFTLVPVEKRVVFGGLVALGWNVYLGLVMGE